MHSQLNTNTFDHFLSQVQQAIGSKRCPQFDPDLNLWIELDFDSLEMVELMENLGNIFGVDFLAEDLDLRLISTPRKIVEWGMAKRKDISIEK